MLLFFNLKLKLQHEKEVHIIKAPFWVNELKYLILCCCIFFNMESRKGINFKRKL